MSDVRGMRRVRWVVGEEPEMQCATCYEYMPITTEFWVPVHGLRRCRACWIDGMRAANRIRRTDHEYRDGERKAAAAQRAVDRREYARNFYRRKYSTLARFQRGAA